MPEDNITIPFSSFKKLVKSFGEELFKRSPDADRTTEPFDVPFLDYMLELQSNHTNKGDKNG